MNDAIRLTLFLLNLFKLQTEIPGNGTCVTGKSDFSSVVIVGFSINLSHKVKIKKNVPIRMPT